MTIYIVVKGIFGYTYSVHLDIEEAYESIFNARDFDPDEDTSPFEIEKWDKEFDSSFINNRVNVSYSKVVEKYKEQQNG